MAFDPSTARLYEAGPETAPAASGFDPASARPAPAPPAAPAQPGIVQRIRSAVSDRAATVANAIGDVADALTAPRSTPAPPPPMPAAPPAAAPPAAPDFHAATASAAPEAPAPGTGGIGSEFLQGLEAGAGGQNISMLGGAMEAGGVLADKKIPILARALRAGGQKLQDYGTEVTPTPQVGSIADVPGDGVMDTLERFGKLAAFKAGSGIGTSLPSVAIGGAAGLATANPTVGLIAGQVGPSYVQNLGDVYISATNDPEIAAAIKAGTITDEQVAKTAALAAIPIAALDIAGLSKILGPAFKPAKDALRTRILRGIATGAIAEGSTEGLQDVVSQWAQSTLGQHKELGDRVIEVVDNVLGGVFAGGLMGGVAGVGDKPEAAPAPGPRGATPKPGKEGELISPAPAGTPRLADMSRVVEATARGEVIPVQGIVNRSQAKSAGASSPAQLTGENGPTTNIDVEERPNIVTDAARRPRETLATEAGHTLTEQLDQARRNAPPANNIDVQEGADLTGVPGIEHIDAAYPPDGIEVDESPMPKPPAFEPVGAGQGALPANAPKPADWRAKWDTKEVGPGRWRVVGMANGNPISPAFSSKSDAEVWADNQGASTIDAAAHEAATSPQNTIPEPTDSQKEAGNYPMGHTTIGGLDVSIENPEGSVRRAKKDAPVQWETKMRHHYGYFRGTVGMDGDHVDTFIKPGTPENFDGTVFVVDQNHPDGKPDEHKVMLGFGTVDEAKQAYHDNYTKGWKGYGGIVAMPMTDFATWLKDGSTSRPAVEWARGRSASAAPTKNPAREAAKAAPEATPTTPNNGQVRPEVATESSSQARVSTQPTAKPEEKPEAAQQSNPAAAELGGEAKAQPPSQAPAAAPAPAKATTEDAPLTVETYSDKAIIVRGDTRTHKDRIKAIGGALWNKKAGGWIFKASKRADVERGLADLLAQNESAPPKLDKIEAENPAPTPTTGPKVVANRARLLAIAKNLGVTVDEAGTGFHARDGAIAIPTEDMSPEVLAAVSVNHVFAHELGHAVMQKRGYSYAGFPVAELRKQISNWDELVAASKAFRPGLWNHSNSKVKLHVRKPNEVIADAVGSVILNDDGDLTLLRGLPLNARDLGLQAPAEKPTPPAGPRLIGKNHRGEDVYEDANGVRSYVDSGVSVQESVQLRPTREGMRASVDPEKRKREFKTTDEHPPAEQKPNPIATRFDQFTVAVNGFVENASKHNDGQALTAAKDARKRLGAAMNAWASGDMKAAGEALRDAGNSLFRQWRVPAESLFDFADEIDPKAEEHPLNPVLPDRAPIDDLVATMLKDGKPFTSPMLFEAADRQFGGTQAQGKYVAKDAYDVMETAFNKYLLDQYADAPLDVKQMIGWMETEVQRLPTQTKRDDEQQAMQQFSTPPMHGAAMAWVANINPQDVVLEPTAGTGNLVTQALLQHPAKVYANELSDRRVELLKSIPGMTDVFKFNANHLNAILPKEVVPTVVIMNPPFSADVNKAGEKDLLLGAKHVEQALKRLAPGGRLVALVGRGMAFDRMRTRDWWKQIRKDYTVLANIGIDGEAYRKFGTTFDNNLLVIDKTGPTTDDPVTGNVKNLGEAVDLLKGVRDGRRDLSEQPAAEPVRESDPVGRAPASGSRAGARDAVGGVGTGERPAESDRGRQAPARVDAGNDGRTAARPSDEGAAGAGRPGRVEPTGTADSATESGSEPAVAGGDTGKQSRAVVEVSPAGPQQNAVAAGTRRTRELGESVFENYEPAYNFAGAKPHPDPIAESAAMSSVELPALNYSLSIPSDVIKQGKLSSAQLESIAYAGQSHETFLSDGETRRGFFIGDGTGVGKGAQIAGVILDNWNKGRRKAVWVSENTGLRPSAERDIEWVGLDRKKVRELKQVEGTKDDAILFTTYAQLTKTKGKSLDESGKVANEGTRNIDAVVKWLGEDFDGVIAFDESHNMRSGLDEKGARGEKSASQVAIHGIELQKLLPKARVVYVSATGATEVKNLAYAERMGLWGEGTPFPTKKDFISSIEAGGVAAMEVVAKDMKAMGLYVARSLSYDGVTTEKLEHPLTDEQRENYDKLATAWQIALQNIDKALQLNNSDKNGAARSAAMSAFWGAHQRFFSTILTSMQAPTLFRHIEAQLAAGNSAVLQLVNTNEAVQERRIEEMEAAGMDLEDADFTPRDIAIQMVRKSFPTDLYEAYTDEDGNKRTRVVVGPDGKAVQNPEAEEMRDRLIEDLAGIAVPEGILDQVINHFGPEAVAEITGRSRRVVRKKNGAKEIEKLGKAYATKDAQAFDDGRKRVLVFSDAGGTGRSYHANRAVKNQQRRVHYLVQAGWRADKAMQGLGRTHRTNQVSAPHDVLVTTNVAAQRRFISTIAARLASLGALTKGQRDTTSGGLLSAADDVGGSYGNSAVESFFRDLRWKRIEGLDFDDVLSQMGINEKQVDEVEVEKFLNRLLSLRFDTMNKVFEAFMDRFDATVEYAKQQGYYDSGVETLRAARIDKVDQRTVWESEGRGQTKYVKLEVSRPTKRYAFDEVAGMRNVEFMRNRRSGKLWAMVPTSTITDPKTGAVVQRLSQYGPGNRTAIAANETYGKFDTVDKDAPSTRAEWDKAYNDVPSMQATDTHMITGALLPIWDRLPQTAPKIVRAQTSDGEVVLGRIIPEDQLETTLTRLGADATGAAQQITGESAARAVYDQGKRVELANGWMVKRSLVAGEQRIEITGPIGSEMDILRNQGAFTEIVAHKRRVFVPVSDAGSILDRLFQSKPAVRMHGTDSGVKHAAAEPDGPPEAGAKYAARPSTGAPERGLSASELHDYLVRIYGGQAIRNLLRTGKLRIVASTDPSLPQDAKDSMRDGRRIYGLYDEASDTTFLIHNNLTDAGQRVGDLEDGAAIFLHEMGVHYGMPGFLGQDHFNVITKQLRLAAKANSSELGIAARAAYAQVPASTRADHVDEEALAWLVTDRANHKLGLVKRILMKIRAWLVKHGFKNVSSPDELVELARGAVNHAAGERLRTNGGARFAARDVTNTEAFKNWFGDSKAVDESGRPLRLYHGTTASFDEFNPNMNPFEAGVFLTPDRAFAAFFTQASYGEMARGGNIMPVYARLTNPLVVDFEGTQFPYETGVGDIINRAKKAGHDGVILRDVVEGEAIYPDGLPTPGAGTDQYIVFNPEQVKSATGNSGAFSPDSPSILYARREPENPSRRGFVMGAAATLAAGGTYASYDNSTLLGKARALSDGALSQRMTKAEEKLLRGDGGVQLDGPKRVRQVLDSIAKTGPTELRALAAKVRDLMPTDGFWLQIDDHSRVNAHGALEFEPLPMLTLFTAEDRHGLRYGTFIHESLHAAVAARYHALSIGVVRSNDAVLGVNAPTASPELEQFQRIWNEFRTENFRSKPSENAKLSADEAARSPDEFFVRALTDAAFQRYLASIEYRGETLWERFKDWVTISLLGLRRSGTRPSWLDAALAASGDLLTAMEKDPSDFARSKATVAESYSQRDAMYSRRVPVEDAPALEQSLMQRARQRFEPWLDAFRYEAQDKFHFLKKAQKEAAAERDLPELPENEDAYLAELRYHGMAGAAIEDFQRDHVDPMLKAIKDAGLDIDRVDEFLHARHANEANAQLRKINPTADELEQRIAEAAESGDFVLASRLANHKPYEGDNSALSGMSGAEARAVMAKARADGKFDALEDIGRRVDEITAARRDLLVSSGLEKRGTIAAWENAYQHYVPLKREGKGDALPRRGKGYDTRGKEKRRAGSNRAVEHILANVVAQHEATLMRAEKAKVGRAMMTFALKNPNPELYEVNKVDYQPTFDAQGLVTYRADPGMVTADNVFVVRVRGQDHRITFNDANPDAMKIAAAIKNLGAEESGPIINVLSKFTRILSLVNTGANPEFIISNFARDIQTAGYNLSGTEADALKWQIIGDVGKAWSGIRKFQKQEGGVWADHFDAFRKAGGQTGWMDHYKDINDREKALINKVRDMEGGAWPTVKRGLKAIDKFIEDENTAVENAIRLSAFVHAREAGLTEAQAARLAKELTVNFNRRGAMGKTLNALYLFYNASIQGQVRIVQAIAKSRKVQGLVAATVIGATLLDMWNRAVGDDDDDDKPNPYDSEAMRYVKDRNLVFMLPGGDYIKIPLPWGYNVFHVMGQSFGEMLTKPGASATGAAARVAGAVVDAFNPIGGSASPLQMISPTIVDPVAQWYENKDFAGRPLRPSGNPFGPEKPESQKYWSSVRPYSKWITDTLNTLTGGDEVRPGAIDFSPEAIDLVIDTFTGGAGRFVADTIGAPWKKFVQGEPIETYEVPLLRKVYGTPGTAQTTQDYYKNRDAIALTQAQLSHYKTDGVKLREVRAQHAADLRMIPALKSTEAQLKKLREARKLSKDRAREREIEDRMHQVMDRFNDRYYKVVTRAAD